MTAARAAVAAGCDYLDTADNYCHVNELIREALYPYPDGNARGHGGSPYYWLCAIGGLAYALAIAFFRWRG